MRILLPTPLGPSDCVVGIRPKSLGTIVDAIGTSSFVNTVAMFVNEHLEVTSVHIDRWRADTSSASGYLVDWLGSWDMGRRSPEFQQLMDLYYRAYWHIDPLLGTVRGSAGTLMLLRHVTGLADGEFRRLFFEEPQVAQECMLVHGNAKVQYALSLTRSNNQAALETDELFHLRQMAELLFPLIELHMMRTPRCIALQGDVTANNGLDVLLKHQNIQLSGREREICLLLLNRWSVAEAASQLEIKLSTAETYVKRAFVKLGVRTHGELRNWARFYS